MRKKKILFHSDFSKIKSGFGRNSKAVLSYLYKTGKYDLVEYAMAPLRWSSPDCQTVPWKCRGALPDNDQELAIAQSQGDARMIGYGSLNIDRIIEQEKPDVYLGIQDPWYANGYWDKPWWKITTPVLWTTIDSLPLLPLIRDNISKIPNLWSWASFGTREIEKLGYKAHTLHGMFPTEEFFPLDDKAKLSLRQRFNISPETVVFGFVFRNQLRKLVGSLLESFVKFKTKNPQTPCKLILHTNWSEGWSIPEFLKEFKINQDDVLTTYICHHCKEIDINPFTGQGVDCRFCGAAKSKHNPNIGLGCSERQLNLIYNTMDAYIHPMTSGGLEMPIVEAMLAGLPVSTIPYSCGTDFTDQKFVHSISYTEYRECPSNFIKASPDTDSICNFMQKVANNRNKYKSIGLESRQWALEEFSTEKIGGFIENFLDNAPFVEEDKWNQIKHVARNDSYEFQNIEDSTEWLTDMYKNILKRDEPVNSEGMLHWKERLDQGVPRQQIHKFFLGEAKKENQKHISINLNSLFLNNGKKRLLYMIPTGGKDCIASLPILSQLRKQYDDEWDIYVSSEIQNEEYFRHLDFLAGFIPYSQELDDFKILEGRGQNKGFCDIVLQPYATTQRFQTYIHNGLDLNELQ